MSSNFGFANGDVASQILEMSDGCNVSSQIKEAVKEGDISSKVGEAVAGLVS